MTCPIVILAALALLIPASAKADCGEERAAVKLGLDADARRVPLTPVPVTIAELVLRPAPRHPPEAIRVTDEHNTERTVYVVHATITGYKLERDGDYHIVIADEHGTTMIVEIPAVDCAAGGPWGKQVEAARDAFDAMVAEHRLPRPGAKLHTVHIEASVTGVGFYDKIHGQVGAARNGVELHPVLAIEAGGGR